MSCGVHTEADTDARQNEITRTKNNTTPEKTVQSAPALLIAKSAVCEAANTTKKKKTESETTTAPPKTIHKHGITTADKIHPIHDIPHECRLCTHRTKSAMPDKTVIAKPVPTSSTTMTNTKIKFTPVPAYQKKICYNV